MKRLILLLMIICLTLTLLPSVSVQTVEAAEKPKYDIYRIGVYDEIDVKVLDHGDMSTRAIVTVDGTIIMPYIGAVYVKDRTLSEINEEITKKLSEGYLKYPVVTVSLTKSMSKKVFLYGEVGRTGMYPLEEGMTTVLRVISLAGGIRDSGIHGNIKLRRKQKNTSEYKEVFLGTKDSIEKTKKGNMILKNDDILIIESNETILLQGEVVRRGRQALETDMTVLRALIDAGGVTGDGLHGNIKIRRKQEGEFGGYKVVGESRIENGIIMDKKVEDIYMKPDDVLIVERNKTFLIQGEVAKRGRYVLENNMTVLRALLEAGGVSDDGRYGKIKVRRKQEGKASGYKDFIEGNLNAGIIDSNKVEDTVLQPDDILIVDRNDTFFIHGELGRTGEFVLEKGMTVTKAISLAGGIRSDGLYGKVKVRRNKDDAAGYKDIEIDFKGTVEGDTLGDILLQPEDILIVERNKTFFVYGEINKSGEFILQDRMTVFQAITIAGGFTKWGSGSRVKILRSKKDKSGLEMIKVDIDKVIDGDINADIELQPGDTVVVSSGIF